MSCGGTAITCPLNLSNTLNGKLFFLNSKRLYFIGGQITSYSVSWSPACTFEVTSFQYVVHFQNLHIKAQCTTLLLLKFSEFFSHIAYCVPFDCKNKQWLFIYALLTVCSLWWKWIVFSVGCDMNFLNEFMNLVECQVSKV
jgi:hypothetical protein